MRIRPEHKFEGEGRTCARCGHPETIHRSPRPRRVDMRFRDARIYAPRPTPETLFVGIDGEGQGRKNHLYTMLCASDELGERTWKIENPDGLDAEEVFEWLMKFPRHVQLFAYSFNYDLTKIFTAIPNERLYRLLRPELRQRFGKDAYKGPRAVPWGKWRLNLQGTKFAVRVARETAYNIIWDIWKFFQCKFTTALLDWKVGDAEEVKFIQYMKDHRHEFDQLDHEQVTKYCFNECRLMAALARKLTDAHIKAGIPLKNYYGAGSSATSMLNKMEVKKCIAEPPSELVSLIAMAFFGGRFDNSVIGEIKGKVYNRDISSAYPYQLYQLPCLVHGKWSHTKRRNDIEDATLALVHYTLPVEYKANGTTKVERPWGPFPFREKDGSISYPASSGGGWVWKKEYLAGEAIFPNVHFREAWIYHCDCDCHPFKMIPEFYNERVRIGKEGPGIALKLGTNSCAGKTAQAVGSGKFRSFIWAGNINGGCRAQVLEALGAHSNWWNMYMVATDGILTSEKIELPKPIDTGTSATGKPLGGWEEKCYDDGVFMARPGVYFPRNPTKEDIKSIRGRGVGRGVVYENHERIVDRWNNWDGILRPAKKSDRYDRDGWPMLRVANVSRFCGAKSSIHRSLGEDKRWKYSRAAGDHCAKKPEPHYGQWVTREVVMSFNPKPKRAQLLDDGIHLALRHIPQDLESVPYDRANISEEARQLMLLTLEANEQPDADLADYE